ncbi:MAG: hypothetical protein ACK5RO_12550 [Pseudobdellovibrionaceae bacterium]
MPRGNVLIQSKDQDRRRLDRQIDGIMMSMAEAGTSSRRLLAQKLEESVELKEAIDHEMSSLRDEKTALKAVAINLNDAQKVLREFNKGFDTLPMSEQKEILKDVMKRITVYPDRVRYEIYGQEGEEESPLDAEEGLPLDDSGRPLFLDQHRTRVRPGNGLVELKYQQTNRSTNTISLNFPLVHPHEFTKNALHFTRAASPFEILKSEQEFLKQLFVKR